MLYNETSHLLNEPMDDALIASGGEHDRQDNSKRVSSNKPRAVEKTSLPSGSGNLLLHRATAEK